MSSPGRNVDRQSARRWVLVGYLVGTSALLLAPIPTPGGAPTNLDKIAHALLMGILAVLVWLAVPIPRWRRGLVSAVGTIAYAGGMELVQGLTTFRTTELADVLAGGLGAVLAIAVLLLGTSHSPLPPRER